MPKRIVVSRLGASFGKGWRPAAPPATSPAASSRMTSAVQWKMCRRGSPHPVILSHRRRPEAGTWRAATSAERSPRRGRIGYSTGCVRPASVPTSTASSSSPSPRTPWSPPRTKSSSPSPAARAPGPPRLFSSFTKGENIKNESAFPLFAINYVV